MSEWSQQQLEVLAEHWRKPDPEVAELLAAVGDRRTIYCIEKMRKRLGYIKPRGGTLTPAQRSARTSAIFKETSKAKRGWPSIKGTPESREKLYQKRLQEGLEIERQRLARALAKQEAA